MDKKKILPEKNLSNRKFKPSRIGTRLALLVGIIGLTLAFFQSALDLITSMPGEFDLLISGMTMPQMTGTKLSEKVKEIQPDLPIIICTDDTACLSMKTTWSSLVFQRLL